MNARLNDDITVTTTTPSTAARCGIVVEAETPSAAVQRLLDIEAALPRMTTPEAARAAVWAAAEAVRTWTENRQLPIAAYPEKQALLYLSAAMITRAQIQLARALLRALIDGRSIEPDALALAMGVIDPEGSP